MTSRARTLHLVALGCAKNRIDAEVLLGVARAEGWTHVDDPASADVLVVSTCGFIGEAKKESIAAILEMAAHREARAGRRLVVSGCLSQRYPADLAAELPEVDAFLGANDAPRFRAVLRGETPRVFVGDPDAWLAGAGDERVLTTRGGSAYVKIAEGCSRRCSFCVIPRIRGRQRSRPADDVVREVESLAARGVVEVNLVSQDTVAWGRDLPAGGRPSLADLVGRVADVRGIRWVRLLYLYPEALSDALVECLAQHPRVVPYVDMPMQHVADGVLRRMRRGHGGARARAIVERLRGRIPGLFFRTTFLVGHPGEAETDFQDLCDFVRWARFDYVVAFRWSDEEGTASHAMDGKVPARVASARRRRLLSIARPASQARVRSHVGRDLDVLVEGPSEEHPDVLVGRHAGQAPEVDGVVYLGGAPARPATIRRARILRAAGWDLLGEPLAGAGSEGASGPLRSRRSLPLVTGRE